MKNAIFLFVTILLTNGAFAQKSFEEFTQLKSKQQSKYINLWKVFKIDKYGRGIFPDLTKKEIKKVALVAYTISTPVQWNKYGSTYNLTEEGIKDLATKLYIQSIDITREAFKSHGIELVTWDDMSDEQKAILSKSEGRSWLEAEEKSSKLYTGYNKLSSKQANLGTSVKGYKNWKVIFDLAWPWATTVLGKLAVAMDVDAVLLINHEINISKDFGYSSCLITMAGENPIPKIEGRSYPGLSYVDGKIYGQGNMIFYKPIVFATVKKKKIVSENYEKFGEFTLALTQALLEDIKSRQEAVK